MHNLAYTQYRSLHHVDMILQFVYLTIYMLLVVRDNSAQKTGVTSQKFRTPRGESSYILNLKLTPVSQRSLFLNSRLFCGRVFEASVKPAILIGAMCLHSGFS